MAITDILSSVVSAASRFLPQSSRAVDVVAITGAGFAPLFPNARPLTAEVSEIADLMEHPLETGAVIADHIVIQPVEIDLPMICVGESAYRSTYQAIRTAYLTGQVLTVTTRTGSYPNMVLTDIPHEEHPDVFDGITIKVRLREARFVTPQSSSLSQSKVANPSQSSTVARGTAQTSAANASQASAASSAYGASGSGVPASGSSLYRWTYGQ